MNKKFLIYRLIHYYQQNGFIYSINRIKKKLSERSSSSWSIVFYRELTGSKENEFQLPDFISIERKEKMADISDEDMSRLCDQIGEKFFLYLIANRFKIGANLWLVRYYGQLAGFIWTIRGMTVEPFYFPLTDNDVFFFDGSIFPEYRRKNIYTLLSIQIRHVLIKEGITRSYFDAFEWNKSVLQYYAKSNAQPIGKAKIYHLFGKTIVVWSNKDRTCYR